MEIKLTNVEAEDIIKNPAKYIQLAKAGKLFIDTTEEVYSGFKLPGELLTPYFNQDAFQTAINKGIVRVKDNKHLEWCGGSKSALTYFIGRIWCGDKPMLDNLTKEQVWKTGAGFYPNKAINELFSTKRTREIRKNRRKKPLPKGHLRIDLLF